MANVLKVQKQLAVLHLLAEDSSIRSAERLTGVHRDTICRLLADFGKDCRTFLDERMRSLRLKHLECDEIWTFVAKKQSRLTIDERTKRGDIGDMYLWTALDKYTKLLPAFLVGKRSADNARRFMVDVAGRLVKPDTSPHASDAHAYRPEAYPATVQISTDGFKAYPEAVDLAFGPFVKYGTIIKDYKNATMAYTPSEMVGTNRRGVYGIDESEERTICTSHVERNNLTIRTFMKRFTRLALGFSKKLENLEAAIAMFVAFYNYCWRTRLPGKSGRKRPTAAMMAGLADHVWTFEELFSAIRG